MEEITVENNPLGIKLYVNGRPSINNMNKEEYEICYGPQKLDKEIITLFVNEFGTVPGSFRSE